MSAGKEESQITAILLVGAWFGGVRDEYLAKLNENTLRLSPGEGIGENCPRCFGSGIEYVYSLDGVRQEFAITANTQDLFTANIFTPK